jgi:hypothetical protein
LPGRGLLTFTCLLLIALSCLGVVRKLEREQRLLAKLRARGALGPENGLPLDTLTPEERAGVRSLAAAGVLGVRRNQCYLHAAELRGLRRKRIRLAISGALGALLLVVLVAALSVRR